MRMVLWPQLFLGPSRCLSALSLAPAHLKKRGCNSYVGGRAGERVGWPALCCALLGPSSWPIPASECRPGPAKPCCHQARWVPVEQGTIRRLNQSHDTRPVAVPLAYPSALRHVPSSLEHWVWGQLARQRLVYAEGWCDPGTGSDRAPHRDVLCTEQQ